MPTVKRRAAKNSKRVEIADLPPLNDDRGYTMEEAGAYIAASKPTLYGLMHEGKLQTYKIGKSRRVRGSAIRACQDKLAQA